ncbi:MAG: hypothetical protein GXO79_07530 [Chlorobi bacterium]|nr:hypothetical protein [Chlorobiota bacterium]
MFIKKIEILKDSVLKKQFQNDSLIITLNILIDSLKNLQKELNLLENNNSTLNKNNEDLNNKIAELKKVLNEKDNLVQEQITSLEKTEKILFEKEQIYKEVIYNSKIDSLQLALKLQSKNTELEANKNITKLLEKNIEEKKINIQEKKKELEIIKKRSELNNSRISILKDTIALLQINRVKNLKDIAYLQSQIKVSDEQIKTLRQEIDDCKNKDKKKKVRIVQGVAIKTFRTPEYELAPKDVNNTNVYVINNKNAGNLEIDYITGASIKILDLMEKNGLSTSDLSLFVGIGGKDLFKNFYFAPNISFLNVLHLNFGFNVHELKTLKPGFNEGDILKVGTPIPTNSSWKINGYFGITLDLTVASGIFKKK